MFIFWTLFHQGTDYEKGMKMIIDLILIQSKGQAKNLDLAPHSHKQNLSFIYIDGLNTL